MNTITVYDPSPDTDDESPIVVDFIDPEAGGWGPQPAKWITLEEMLEMFPPPPKSGA